MKRYARFLIIGLVLVAWATTADAQQLLKQSTAATVRVGPFLDEDDGKTAETALTVSQADVRLSKAGGAFAQKNETSAATHDENGWYSVDLDATDTGTLGQLTIAIHESGALPVWQYYTVVTDAKFAELTGDDAPVVTYVVHDGNDITSGTNLKTVTEAASAGHLVLVGAGNYTTTDHIEIPAGVVVKAAELGSVHITSSGSLIPNSNVVIDGLIYTGTTNPAVVPKNDTKGIYVRNCLLVGLPDIVQLQTDAGEEPPVNEPIEITFANCHMIAPGSFGEGILVHSNAGHELTLIDCTVVINDNTGAPHGIRQGAGTVRMKRCTIDTSDVTGVPKAIGVSGTGLLIASDTSFILPDDVSAVAVSADGPDGTVILSNCEFNRDAISLTNSPTFIDQLSPLQPTVAGRTVGINASGHVERVVVNDTTTENTDMRGTEDALLATSAPANFPDLSITAGTGLVTTDAASRTASQADVSGLATPAEVKSQADAAIETYGLHYLFQTAYDPSNKPGDPAGLLNVLVENDGGVPRLTANALEEAPSGGSGAAGGPVELRLPARMFTWKVERRFDGKVVIERAITVAAGEQNVFLGFDSEKLLDTGDYLKTMTAPTATGTGVTPETTAGRYGHDRTIAKLYVDVDPQATPGDRTIETTVTTENGGGPYRLRAILTVAD